MIERGMIQCITVPEKKMGKGRVTIRRRTPDLRLEETKQHRHLLKLVECYQCGAFSCVQAYFISCWLAIRVLLK